MVLIRNWYLMKFGSFIAVLIFKNVKFAVKGLLCTSSIDQTLEFSTLLITKPF